MNRMSVERRPVVRKVRGVSPYQYALGLDLGQVRDHSAIVVVEQVTSCFDLEAEGYIRLQAPEYRVRHVERFPLGTTYPAIVDGVEETLADPALTGKNLVGRGRDWCRCAGRQHVPTARQALATNRDHRR